MLAGNIIFENITGGLKISDEVEIIIIDQTDMITAINYLNDTITDINNKKRFKNEDLEEN